jgi:hypothetical protein
MVTITTQNLLLRAAHQYVDKRKSFSKEEIVKRINQIKYLSEQKKVPKLTLRKEIIHLENKLESIYNLEKKIFEHEKRESAKVTSLKKEVNKLKALLTTSEDEDLRKKVDKLSHVLGDSLARKHVIEDIALSKQVINESITIEKRGSSDMILENLQKKLDYLKNQVKMKSRENPELARMIEQKINFIENKIHEKLPRKEIPIINEKPKHRMIFSAPPPKPLEMDVQALEKELPLPPPPRMG